MKILLITDIHSDFEAAYSAGVVETPDLVLDCGDHEQIKNIFGSTPHLYIRGNHEPKTITFQENDAPLPNQIPFGSIISFSKENSIVNFSGIDGNYSSKESLYEVDVKALGYLKSLPTNAIDILLLHESPLNVPLKSKQYSFAKNIILEINRIEPKFVLSGHTGIYSEYTSPCNVKFINLDDMCNGYGVINVSKNNFNFIRKKACYGRS